MDSNKNKKQNFLGRAVASRTDKDYAFIINTDAKARSDAKFLDLRANVSSIRCTLTRKMILEFERIPRAGA